MSSDDEIGYGVLDPITYTSLPQTAWFLRQHPTDNQVKNARHADKDLKGVPPATLEITVDGDEKEELAVSGDPKKVITLFKYLSAKYPDDGKSNKTFVFKNVLFRPSKSYKPLFFPGSQKMKNLVKELESKGH